MFNYINNSFYVAFISCNFFPHKKFIFVHMVLNITYIYIYIYIYIYMKKNIYIHMYTCTYMYVRKLLRKIPQNHTKI